MCNECNSSKGTSGLQDWLASRLEHIGRNVEQTRESVKDAWNAILSTAPEETVRDARLQQCSTIPQVLPVVLRACMTGSG